VFVIGLDNGAIVLYDMSNGTRRKDEVKRHTGSVSGVAFVDEHTFISTCMEKMELYGYNCTDASLLFQSNIGTAHSALLLPLRIPIVTFVSTTGKLRFFDLEQRGSVGKLGLLNGKLPREADGMEQRTPLKSSVHCTSEFVSLIVHDVLHETLMNIEHTLEHFTEEDERIGADDDDIPQRMHSLIAIYSVNELMRTFFAHVAQLVPPNSKMKSKDVYKRFVLHGATPLPKSVMKGSTAAPANPVLSQSKGGSRRPSITYGSLASGSHAGSEHPKSGTGVPTSSTPAGFGLGAAKGVNMQPAVGGSAGHGAILAQDLSSLPGLRKTKPAEAKQNPFFDPMSVVTDVMKQRSEKRAERSLRVSDRRQQMAEEVKLR
jgi:hypothetical protein